MLYIHFPPWYLLYLWIKKFVVVGLYLCFCFDQMGSWGIRFRDSDILVRTCSWEIFICNRVAYVLNAKKYELLSCCCNRCMREIWNSAFKWTYCELASRFCLMPPKIWSNRISKLSWFLIWRKRKSWCKRKPLLRFSGFVWLGYIALFQWITKDHVT